MMKVIFRIILAAIALAAALYFLFRSISLQEAMAALQALSLPLIASIVVLSLTISLIKATRFFILVRWSGIDAPWIKTILTFKASEIFTPLPGGEVGRAVLFKKRLHAEMPQIAIPVFLHALLELWSAACIAVIGAATFEGQNIAWIIAPAVILAALTVPLAAPHAAYRLLMRVKSERAWIVRLRETTKSIAEFVKKGESRSHRRALALVIALGLTVHVVAGVMMWQIAASEGATITIFQGAFAAAAASLIQDILWIVPGGLGFTEGGLAVILSSFALAWDKAVATTLLYRTAMLPFSLALALAALAVIYAPKGVKIMNSP